MSMQDGWARIEAGQARATGAGGAKALLDDGYAVLDIRPAKEFANGRVAGAVHVPLFVADDGSDPVTLLKKAVSSEGGRACRLRGAAPGAELEQSWRTDTTRPQGARRLRGAVDGHGAHEAER